MIMKKGISILVAIFLIAATLTGSFAAVNNLNDEPVVISAEALNTLTIKQPTTIPSEGDYNGILEISAGTYNIQRDYSQSAIITVKNTGDWSIEYYLTVLNVYDDIYLNFVRSGSAEIPLVIAAGETQQIQLDIFAQNTKRGDYEFPIFAHIVSEDGERTDAKSTAYVNCPVVNLNVSLTKISEDVNTLAQVYSLVNRGASVTDMTVSLEGELYDYVMLTPINDNVHMNSGETIEFTAMPDLAKMKVNNITRIEGQIVVSAGGASHKCNAVFDTKGQDISTITVAELVALQMSGFSNDTVSIQKTGMGTIKIPSNDKQCTNAGKVTTKVRGPSISSGINTQSIDDSKVRVFLTSRMYGGSYVNKADTNYDYYVNGVKTATSHNSGLTEVSIVELPTDNFKFGAMNTIVRDYDTNPGSHFVTANTEISFLIPGETEICYIGSPETLPDYRSLPDFAVYAENIYSSSDDMIIGNEDEININIYNRGSEEGTFNIEVTDKDGVIYSEESHYLDAFSGDKISFKWTPVYNQEKITVKITNTTVGIPEENLTNNVAEKVFSIRERLVPEISSITPDYGVIGESVIYATVRNYLDVVDVKFYIDGTLYTGEIKSSPYGGYSRYWINDETMSVGSHEIRVVVEYANTGTTTATVEKSIDFDVLNFDWNHYKVNVDENIKYPNYFVCKKDTYSYKYVYVDKNGKERTYQMTKEEVENRGDYLFVIASDNAVLFNSLNETKDLKLEDCNELKFVGENVEIYDVVVTEINNTRLYSYLDNSGTYALTPAKYQINVSINCMDYYKTVTLEVDLTSGDAVVDLSKQFDVFTFNFTEKIKGDANFAIGYQETTGGDWYYIYPDVTYSGNSAVAVVTDGYDCRTLHNAKNAFVVALTDDILFIKEIETKSGCLDKVFTISKDNLQKYSLVPGDDSAYGITSVKVQSDKVTTWLYSSTIYVSPDDYEITVYCEDINAIDFVSTASNNISYVESQANDKAAVKIIIGSAFDNHANVYGAGVGGAEISADKYVSGTTIEADKDIYNLNLNLKRNESTYTVNAVADARENDAVVSIGNLFDGDIVNTFETHSGYSEIRVYLDNLKDENGNELVAFTSKDEANKLYGQLTLTNVDNSADIRNIWIELDNVSYFDVILPDAPGTYNVSLTATTSTELIGLKGLVLSESEISLACGDSWWLSAEAVPENIELTNLVWSSSDENIAVVDENGVVTAGENNTGTVVITVSTEDGLYTASCVVNVVMTPFQRIIYIFKRIVMFFLEIFR